MKTRSSSSQSHLTKAAENIDKSKVNPDLDPARIIPIIKNENKNKNKKKRHECIICKIQFKKLTSLSTHLLTHDESKSRKVLLSCSIPDCTFETSRPTKLKIHERTHTGWIPFSCPHCPKEFTQKGNLGRHFSKHHPDEFRLDPTFTTRIQKAEKKEAKFQCQHCQRGFSQKGNLRRHIEYRHPNEIETETENQILTLDQDQNKDQKNENHSQNQDPNQSQECQDVNANVKQSVESPTVSFDRSGSGELKVDGDVDVKQTLIGATKLEQLTNEFNKAIFQTIDESQGLKETPKSSQSPQLTLQPPVNSITTNSLSTNVEEIDQLQNDSGQIIHDPHMDESTVDVGIDVSVDQNSNQNQDLPTATIERSEVPSNDNGSDRVNINVNTSSSSSNPFVHSPHSSFNIVDRQQNSSTMSVPIVPNHVQWNRNPGPGQIGYGELNGPNWQDNNQFYPHHNPGHITNIQQQQLVDIWMRPQYQHQNQSHCHSYIGHSLGHGHPTYPPPTVVLHYYPFLHSTTPLPSLSMSPFF